MLLNVSSVPAMSSSADVVPVLETSGHAVDVARWRRIGTSRLEEPLHVLTIGHGDHHAVVFSGVHPNEPMGGATALHLARALVAHELLLAEMNYTWHIVGCIDPVGMRLNEGWFGGRLDRWRPGRNFYRLPFDEQVACRRSPDYKRLASTSTKYCLRPWP